jgi:hypothetical protein
LLRSKSEIWRLCLLQLLLLLSRSKSELLLGSRLQLQLRKSEPMLQCLPQSTKNELVHQLSKSGSKLQLLLRSKSEIWRLCLLQLLLLLSRSKSELLLGSRLQLQLRKSEPVLQCLPQSTKNELVHQLSKSGSKLQLQLRKSEPVLQSLLNKHELQLSKSGYKVQILLLFSKSVSELLLLLLLL